MSGRVFWWYRTANASPLVTAEFLARERRLLMPAQYAREHENQWVDQADSFVAAEQVDRAMAQGWTEQAAGRRGVEHVMYVDLGAVHDPTVVGIGHREGGLVYVDRLVTLQGSREEPVQLATVEAMIRHLAARFALTTIRIESWQGLAAVQRLQAIGLPVELFTPTAKSNAEEWPMLAQRLAAGTLVLFPHARLREELLNLAVEVGPTGVRVSDRGAVHQDHAVAVRGIVAQLGEPAVRCTYERCPQPDQCPVGGLHVFVGEDFHRLSVAEQEALDQERDELARSQSAAAVEDRVRGRGAWWPEGGWRR